MNLQYYNITINPQGLNGAAATTYSRKVREHLLWVYRTKTGKILLDSIRFYKRPVEIRPYTGGNCNATGGSELVAGNLRGFVTYSPDTFSLHGACSATKSAQNRGLFWDEILFHELVHVFRAVSGKWNNAPLSAGLHRYTNNEEFYAVMVSNIYISDRTNKIKSGLRANHQGFQSLSTDFDDAWELFSAGTQVFSLVEQFCKDHPYFSKTVAHEVAKAQFNPIADYYADRDKARRLSQNAGHRDLAGVIEQMRQIVGI